VTGYAVSAAKIVAIRCAQGSEFNVSAGNALAIGSSPSRSFRRSLAPGQHWIPLTWPTTFKNAPSYLPCPLLTAFAITPFTLKLGGRKDIQTIRNPVSAKVLFRNNQMKETGNYGRQQPRFENLTQSATSTSYKAMNFYDQIILRFFSAPMLLTV